MIYKNKTIKAVALATLFTLTGPMHAFNVWDMWTSFKQNSQAKIAAGFAAATATVASVTYWAYNKYRTNTPVEANPLRKTVLINEYPNASIGSTAYHEAQIKLNKSLNPNLNNKHRKEIFARDGSNYDENNFRRAQKPVLNNASAGSSAYLSALQRTSHADNKHIAERAQAERDTLGNWVAPVSGVSMASGSQAPAQPMVADGGGMSSKPAVVLVPVEKLNREAASFKKHNEQALDNAAELLTEKSVLQARAELAAGDYIGNFITKIAKRLSRIEDGLHDKKISEGDRQKLLVSLAQAREEIFSLNVVGANLDTLYKDNFKRVPSIQPKEAYPALFRLGILKANELPSNIQTADIHSRLEKRQKEIADQQSDEFYALRQLGYIFRNDITRYKYDAYINGFAVPSIALDDFQKLATRLQNIQLDAGEAADDYEWIKSSDHQENQVDIATRIANSVSLMPSAQTTYASFVEANVKKAIAFVQAKISPKASTTTAAAPAENSQNTRNQGEDLMSRAGRMASTAASTAASLATSTASSVVSATTAAGAALLARVSPTASPAGQEVEQRPVVIIDRSEKVAQENQSDVAAAPQPQPAPAIAAAPTPAAQPASAEVDPLSAAPYPENHIQASPSKPAPVINAGKSIV